MKYLGFSIFLILTIFILSSCSSTDKISEDEIRFFAEKLYVLANQYYPSNDVYFSEDMFPIVAMYDLNKDDDCALDYVFHELLIFNLSQGMTCTQPKFIAKTMNSLTVKNPYDYYDLLQYNETFYAKGYHYSLLLIYDFENLSSANFFVSNLEQTVRTLYKEQYDFAAFYTDPNDISLNGVQDNYSGFFYASAYAPFITYENDISMFHLMVLQRDNYVYVHKLHNNESIMQLRLFYLTGILPEPVTRDYVPEPSEP